MKVPKLKYSDIEREDDRLWIRVNDFDVRLVKTDEGLVVDIFSKDYDLEPLASTYAFDSEAVPLFEVGGSYGTMIVKANTGEVLRLDSVDGDEEYKDIIRFDVEEWQREYPDEELEGMYLDILDIGYWVDKGEYVPPELDWREEYRRDSERKINENEYLSGAQR